jgi:hypothetical protein
MTSVTQANNIFIATGILHPNRTKDSYDAMIRVIMAQLPKSVFPQESGFGSLEMIPPLVHESTTFGTHDRTRTA